MLQASRIALLGLLALMQLIAPLVHAHTGGGQFSGAVHLPGLEFLAQPSGQSATLGGDVGLDVIVSLAPGVKTPEDATPPPPDLALAVAAVLGAANGPAASNPHFPPPPDPAPKPGSWLKPAPRAPPSAAADALH
ncbi:MAG: hypothetical protein ACKN9T_15590 [Candidatus Methylumidiphilus sp.]